MCVLVINPKAYTLSEKTLRNCWLRNPNGGGMAWVEKGEIKVFKSLDNFEALYNNYVEVKKRCPRSNILLHFRIKTHGEISLENTHPFVVSPNLVMGHNGVISATRGVTGPKSDTLTFVEEYLMGLPDGFESNERMQKLIKEVIGHSKLAFLNRKNEYFIINSKMGTEDMGCWFSNESYKDSSSYFRDYGDWEWDDEAGTMVKKEKKKTWVSVNQPAQKATAEATETTGTSSTNGAPSVRTLQSVTAETNKQPQQTTVTGFAGGARSGGTMENTADGDTTTPTKTRDSLKQNSPAFTPTTGQRPSVPAIIPLPSLATDGEELLTKDRMILCGCGQRVPATHICEVHDDLPICKGCEDYKDIIVRQSRAFDNTPQMRCLNCHDVLDNTDLDSNDLTLCETCFTESQSNPEIAALLQNVYPQLFQ